MHKYLPELKLINKKPQRADYWSAAYSVTLGTPVLLYPDGGGLDRFYSVYRISDEEFAKYDTDEFDDVIASVKENMQDRYLGQSDTLFDIAPERNPNIVIKSSNSEERKIKNRILHSPYGPKIPLPQPYDNRRNIELYDTTKASIIGALVIILIIILIVIIVDWASLFTYYEVP